MSKRDRQWCAVWFGVIWLAIMGGCYWLATVMTQAAVGMVLVANGVAPGPVINEIPSWEQIYVFTGLAVAGLVIGCLACRYAPDPLPLPQPPLPYEPLKDFR